MKKKYFTLAILTLIIIVPAIAIITSFSGCSNNSSNKYEEEKKQIEATIQTSYRLIALNSIDNTISFTNVLDKTAEIKITYKYNNGAEFSDTVTVESNSYFTKTYQGGYSIATFEIEIISLS